MSSTPVRMRGRTGRRRRQAGYTMIEVVMAIGVLTAGSVGIMALQQASTRGNMEARQMTTATQLAQRWLDRLQRDRLNWTASTASLPIPATLLANTDYLKNVPDTGDAAEWIRPSTVAGDSLAFDHYGAPTADDSSTRYCTEMRLEWVYPGRVMRTDVRVWYRRMISGSTVDPDAAALSGCASNLSPATLTGDPRVRMVYASNLVRYAATRSSSASSGSTSIGLSRPAILPSRSTP